MLLFASVVAVTLYLPDAKTPPFTSKLNFLSSLPTFEVRVVAAVSLIINVKVLISLLIPASIVPDTVKSSP